MNKKRVPRMDSRILAVALAAVLAGCGGGLGTPDNNSPSAGVAGPGSGGGGGTEPPQQNFDTLQSALAAMINAESGYYYLPAVDALDQLFAEAVRRGGARQATAELDRALAEVVHSEDDIWLGLSSFFLEGRVFDPWSLDHPQSLASQVVPGAPLASHIGACVPPTTVIHVNGVWTTYPEFLANVAQLDEALQGIPGIRVMGVWNRSSLDEERSAFGATVCPRVGSIGSQFPLFGRIVNDICREAGGRLIDFAEAAAQAGFCRFGEHTFVGNAGAVSDVVQREVIDGHNVVLVPHSQGNLFARDAVRWLSADMFGRYAESVAVVQTGSPVSDFPSENVRVDVCGDPIPCCSRDTDCDECASIPSLDLELHSFRDSYLSGEALLAIRQHVANYAVALVNPRDPREPFCDSGTLPCGSVQVSESGVTHMFPVAHVVDLERSVGSFTLTYDTFSIPDRIEVFYEGERIFDSGCIGASDSVDLNFAGSSSKVIVTVTPNCSGTASTDWQFEVGCP